MASEFRFPNLIGRQEAPPPPMLSYEDDNGTLLEIFVPSGRYSEALDLIEKQDWKALSQFPRWSDRPAVPSRDPDVMTYTPGNSSGDAQKRSVWLPQGTAERARILLINEDWLALENEFETLTGQKYEKTQAEIEHEEGVERMRKAREDQEASQH